MTSLVDKSFNFGMNDIWLILLHKEIVEGGGERRK